LMRRSMSSVPSGKAALERTARQTSQARERESKRSARDEAKVYASAVREIEKFEREKVRAAERSAADRARAIERAAREEVRTAERAAKEKARTEERELARVQKAAAAQRHQFLGAGPNAAAAARLGGRAARAMVGIAGDVARGAGVQTSLGSFVSNEVDLEKRAVDLTNAAYMPGQAGPNGTRQDPRALIAQMRAVGDATAMDPGKALEGLQKFVAKTGDLQTGRDVLQDMARLARASGAELEDMVDAAGDVRNALGPNGGPEQIKAVMRAIAAQGKEGAVEIKDLATQMAKLSAASSSFEGDGAAVMAQMGALTQMTRAKGGAASATQAATAVGSFTNTFSKGARLDAFKNFGVDLRGTSGKIDLKKVILGSIQAASADKFGGMANFDRNMGKMFMDVQARRVTKGYEKTFIEAGGGEAGLKAVEKALDDMASATINEKEISESFARSMNTTEAQVQLFNNEMSKTANELKTVLTPAFVAMAPAILAATKGVVDWFAKITTIKDRQDDRNRHGVEIRALNASSDLGRAIDSGKIDADEIAKRETEANEAKKALEAEIGKKAKEIDEESRQFSIGLGSKRVSEEDISMLAAQGNEGAEKYLRDREQLESMRGSLESLNRRHDELADKLASKQLKVVIVGDTRAPSLDVDAIGRTPAPGKTKPGPK
jgi:hypothetical protein